MARSPSKKCEWCKGSFSPKGNKMYAFEHQRFCSYSCASTYRHSSRTLETAFASAPKSWNGDCLEWGGSKNHQGYGQVFFKGRHLAHRVSYLLNIGSIPKNLFVCHHCDNPICVNPKHLYAGTAADNSADRVKRGRQVNPAGSDSPNAKLSWRAVRAIRTNRAKGAAMAIKYGVSQATISLIRSNKVWKENI